MSVVSDALPRRSPQEAERNLALLGYGLLFSAVFLAGLPAFAAVAIAYAKRNACDRALSSHFRYQIRTFWVGFFLTLLAALCGLAALFVILIDVIRSFAPDETFGPADFNVVIALGAMTAGLAALSGLWLIGASVYGFVRLASRRTMGADGPERSPGIR